MSDRTNSDSPLEAAARRSRDRAGVASPVGLGYGATSKPAWPTDESVACALRLSNPNPYLSPESVRDALRDALLADPIIKAAIAWASQPVVRANVESYNVELIRLFRAVDDVAGLLE
jgi:hypothetical protein